MHGIAIVVTVLITATQQQLTQLAEGVVPTVTAAQVFLFLLFEFGGMAIVGLIGLAVLFGIWRSWARGSA